MRPYCNGTQTHNRLVRKRRLNHLPKWLKWVSARVQTKWLWVGDPLQELNLQRAFAICQENT